MLAYFFRWSDIFQIEISTLLLLDEMIYDCSWHTLLHQIFFNGRFWHIAGYCVHQSSITVHFMFYNPIFYPNLLTNLHKSLKEALLKFSINHLVLRLLRIDVFILTLFFYVLVVFLLMCKIILKLLINIWILFLSWCHFMGLYNQMMHIFTVMDRYFLLPNSLLLCFFS